MPLLTYATERCREKNIRFSTGFTTNGVLLDSRKLDDLASLGLGGTNFQISFDGHRPFHDVSRVGENRRPTYDRILGNLIEAAKRGVQHNHAFQLHPRHRRFFLPTYSATSRVCSPLNLRAT